MDRSESEVVQKLDDGVPYAPSSSVAVKRRLVEVQAKIRAAMDNAATGPLIIAADVMAVAESWELYEEEAKGLSCDGWLKKNIGRGRGLAFFARRYRAVKFIGEDARRWLHHDAAVWIAQKVPADQCEAVKDALYRAYAKDRTVLSPAQTKAIVMPLIGRNAVRVKTCKRCQMLEKLMLLNGIAVPKK